MQDSPKTATVRFTESKEPGFAHIIRTAPQSVCSTLFLVSLAIFTSISDLGVQVSLLMAALVSGFAVSRLLLLLRHSKRILNLSQTRALELKFTAHCLGISITFAIWSYLIVRGVPSLAPTILLAVTVQAFLAIPFVATSLLGYTAMTLPLMLTGIWIQTRLSTESSLSLHIMVAMTYLFAFRMVFIHRAAVIARMLETSRREVMDRQLQVMMTNDSVAIAMTSGDAITKANLRFSELLDIANPESTKNDCFPVRLVLAKLGFSSKYHDRVIERMVSRTIRSGVLKLNLSITSNTGALLWLRLEARAADPLGSNENLIWLVTDDTQARATRERIAFLAHHDVLTGLANRFVFTQRLQEALATLPNTDKRIAVLSIDLDGFKGINDKYGHAAGDQLLAIVGKRLTHALRGKDLVARFGGDEFVVLLHEVGDLNEAIGVAEKIRDAITSPVEFNELRLQVGASIGIALCPEDGMHIDGILQCADRQMYAQKRATKLPLEPYEERARLPRP